MSDLEITNDWIDRYNENELNEDEKAFFRKRMEDNPLLRTEVLIDACLNSLYQDEGTLDLIKKIHSVSHKTDHGDMMLKYFLIAASLLYLIALGAIVNLMQIDPVGLSDNSYRRSMETRHRSAGRLFPMDFLKVPAQVRKITPVTRREISHKNYLSLNYKPMAVFELLVGSVTRSAHLRVIAPTAILKIPACASVIFKWVYQNRVLPVNIVVFNNRGTLVFETPALLTDSYVMNMKDWPGGIYYWKIIIDEEMIFMGKFTLL